MNNKTEHGEYKYHHQTSDHTESYLWTPVLAILKSQGVNVRILDLGCGNGAFARKLCELGHDVVGIDPSESGIEMANSVSSPVLFETGSAYENLRDRYGEFDCVVSLEVVEHLYPPKEFAKNIFDVLKPGGIAVVSTPYHGYFKNLVLAVTGKLDSHFTALWDHGHIKFWSVKTLSELFKSHGLDVNGFRFAGRIPIMAKSMVAIVSKPKSESTNDS